MRRIEERLTQRMDNLVNIVRTQNHNISSRQIRDKMFNKKDMDITAELDDFAINDKFIRKEE